ncbi:MAG: hypothetical protein LBE13_07295 [Bacteroidales bacterium]|jgi:malate/lactate dehydrogenase|nr:hypothetical protein [Bacteroidales bacterium]
MKISIIGASGKIGLELTRLLLSSNAVNEHCFVLYSKTHKNKNLGLIMDLRSAFILDKKFFHTENLIITNSFIDIVDTDLCIIVAGRVPTPDDEQSFSKKGRDILSYVNRDIILDIADNLLKFSIKSDILVVTNQVDVVSRFLRNLLGRTNIYGLGGELDSTRLRLLLIDNGYTNIINDTSCFVGGYHNQDMFLFSKYFPLQIDYSIIENIMKNVKEYSYKIYILQKDTRDLLFNKSTVFLPARAILDFILAYTGTSKFITTVLNRIPILEEIGFNCDSAQLLCDVQKGIVVPRITHLSDNDLLLLSDGSNNFDIEYKSFSENNSYERRNLQL